MPQLRFFAPPGVVCRHTLTTKDSTLRFVNDRELFTYPKRYFAICCCCGESFELSKDEEGRFYFKGGEEELGNDD